MQEVVYMQRVKVLSIVIIQNVLFLHEFMYYFLKMSLIMTPNAVLYKRSCIHVQNIIQILSPDSILSQYHSICIHILIYCDFLNRYDVVFGLFFCVSSYFLNALSGISTFVMFFCNTTYIKTLN